MPAVGGSRSRQFSDHARALLLSYCEFPGAWLIATKNVRVTFDLELFSTSYRASEL